MIATTRKPTAPWSPSWFVPAGTARRAWQPRSTERRWPTSVCPPTLDHAQPSSRNETNNLLAGTVGERCRLARWGSPRGQGALVSVSWSLTAFSVHSGTSWLEWISTLALSSSEFPGSSSCRVLLETVLLSLLTKT